MSHELFKTANVQASFIAEALLDHVATDGTIYNKVILTIVKRTPQNKAESTMKYFVDIAPAKVVFHDLWTDALGGDHSEFKKHGNLERALNINPIADGYRFSVMNKTAGGESGSLYFDLTRFQARCLARSVLDHLTARELAKMFSRPL
jgi:hypothetical protein